MPEGTDFRGGLRELAAKAAGLPDLEFVAETHKRHRIGNRRMGFQCLGELNTALAVDLQRLAGAVERQRKLLALVRIGRKTRDQPFDLRQQRIAAGVERRPVGGRIAIKAIETVARQYGTEWRRHRDATLGIETQHIMGHKPVHLAPRRAAGPIRPATSTGLRPVHPRHSRHGPGRISGSQPYDGNKWAIMG